MSDSTDLLAPVDDEPAAGGVEPRQLRPYQKEAADAAEQQWREGYERTSVIMATGSGKPIFDNELVPTPDRGFVRMSDLRVGDYVFGSDGEPTRIVHVDPQGVIPLRRVHFDDGASVVAGAGHLWEIKRKGRFPRVETTDWIRKQGYQDRDGYMWRLPIIDPVNYPARDLPLDPYLVGTLIANGDLKSGPDVTTPDIHVIDELERRGVFLNKHKIDKNRCPRWGVPGIRDELRELGLWGKVSRDKRIPRMYLEASDTARLDLLRGLMDGDGSSRSGGRRVCNYHTTSAGLSDDVAELVWSLGGRAKQHTTDRRHEGKPTEYEVGILMPEGISPFLSPRKVRDEHPRRTFKPRRAIVDIEDVADGPATCIQVDAEDGLFAVTDRYVLTHNSSVIAELARRAVRRGQRVVALAHRDELLNQMRDTYSLVAPELEPGGIVKAEIDEHDRDFVCASFQTLAASPKRVEKLGVRNLILVDECHHALAPSYMRVLYDLGLTVPKPRGKKKTNPDEEVFGDHVPQVGSKSKKASDYITQFDHVPEIRACGFTATMARSDSEQLGKVWSTVAFERDISWAIDNGYLITPRSMTVHVPELKGLGNVKTVAGDFNSKQLAEVMEASVESTVDAVQRHAKDRNMIIFAASVTHAEELAAALTIEGIPAGVVVGSSTREVREDTYARFNSGELQALVTVMVLTEGADFPRCDCVVMARPTRSQVLFSQMTGRALRLYTDPETGKEKEDALVLDLSGAAADASLISLTDLWPDAEDEEFDNDGNKLEPPSDTGDEQEALALTQQRRGTIELEAVDLLRRAASSHEQSKKGPPHRRVVALSTAGGVMFIPSSRGGAGMMLWPPHPNRVQNVCVIRFSNYGRTAHPMLDAEGNIMVSNYAVMYDLACRAAYEGKDENDRRTAIMRRAQWRQPGKRPSQKQLDLARKMNAPVPAGASMADVSDAISREFMQANLANMLPHLRQWGLVE